MLSLFNRYDLKTVLLYFLVIIASLLFAFLSEKSRKHKRLFFFISFLCLAIFVSVANCGADRISYQNLYNEVSFPNDEIEIGYSFLMFVFRFFTNNPVIFLSLISFSTVGFVYIGLRKIRSRISIFIAITAFACMYYLQSINLIRMYFAMSILVLGCEYIFKKRYYLFTIFLIVSSTIHYSIIPVLFSYIAIMILSKLFSNKRSIVVAIIALVGIVIVLNPSFFLNKVLSSNFYLFRHYDFYLGTANFANGGLGFKWIFVLIPYFVIFFLWIIQKRKPESIIFYFVIVFFAASFILSIMNYSISGLERARTVFHLPVLALLPYEIERYHSFTLLKVNKNLHLSMNSQSILKIGLTIYFIVTLVVYMDGYLVTDGISNYASIWG